MHRSLLLLPVAALLAGQAFGQCSSLSYSGTSNGQKGTTFEVVNLSATTPINITSFDQAFLAAGTADMEVYTLAGPCAGLELTAGAWTLVGSAAGVVHGLSPQLDPVPIPINITVPPGGTQSFYITCTNATGSNAYYTSGVNQYGVQYASNADVALVGRTGNSYPFGSGFGLPTAGRLWNGQVNYCAVGTGTVFATSSSVGVGCNDRAESFYELFQAGGFDLSNSSMQLVPTGTGYLVIPGASVWHTPTGAVIPLGDDAVSAAQPLGFTLAYPGGTTPDVYISSNGFVWAQPNSNNGCCAGNVQAFLTLGARWCPNWGDLNPASGGTIQFDTDPVAGAAYVTFTDVPEFGTQNLNTFQVAFFSSGIVEYRFQNCLQANRQVLVGWSPGSNNRDPGSVDLSVSLPLTTGPDQIPLSHSISGGRPIAGNTINLVAGNLTPAAPFGAFLLGISNPNLPLGLLGMPGCTQYSDALATLLFLPMGASSASLPFTIPNVVGLPLMTQAVLYDPAAAGNPLGATSSNGFAHTIGDF